MLTSRAWTFLLVVVPFLAVASLAPPQGHPPLALIGLALLLWFLGEWAWFALRTNRVMNRLTVERELRDDRGPLENLWAGRTFEVRVSLRLSGRGRLSYIRFSERLPIGIELISGEIEWQGELTADRPVELSYRIHLAGTGRVRFEGLSIHLADLQGFFYRRQFFNQPATYRVLPMLSDVRGRAATSKRHNLLPPPGLHRHRRPGSGGDLLDLRDYLPGDPPKMIAWKVSARRDRLITKEFESEVPVRCTLFVDTSSSVRVGPPGQNALARQVEIAAAVAQATAGARDLIGLCLFDDRVTDYLRPARGSTHLARLLNLLADSAGLAPSAGRTRPDTLLPLAYSFAKEVYPHLLRKEVNPSPAWLPWLAPQPPSTIRRPRLTDYFYRSPPWLLKIFGLVLVALLLAPLYFRDYWERKRFWAIWLLALAGYLTLSLPFGLLYLLVMAIAFRERRRRARWRKQLAALLSARYGLAPGGLALLLEDDEEFSLCLQRFLAEHQVPYPLPFYDDRGQYLFAAPGKIEVLANVLLRAVRRGQDNELFVLQADLLELTDELGPLLRAVKVTLARHHHVVIICPWPVGIPAPEKTQKKLVGLSVAELVEQATALRFHDAFRRLRKTFARLGVPVICARGEDPARLIIDRLNRLRTLRSQPKL